MIIIRKWMIYAAMLSFLAVTTPDENAHKQKVSTMSENLQANTEEVTTAQLTNREVTYHNIYLFTYTLHNRRVLTFGALGFVINVDRLG